MPSLDSNQQESNRHKLAIEDFHMNLQRLVTFMNSFEHAINAKLTDTNSKLFQLQRQVHFLEEKISIPTQKETTKSTSSPTKAKQNANESISPISN